MIIFLTKNPIALLGLPAVIAAVVYLVDVRPAVRGLRPRQRLVRPTSRWTSAAEHACRRLG